MRIAVLLPFNKPGSRSETGSFIERTFLYIARKHPEHQFYLLTRNTPSDTVSAAVNLSYLPFAESEKTFFSRFQTYRFRLPALLKKIDADVFVGADGVRCIQSRASQLYFVPEYSNIINEFSSITPRWISGYCFTRSLKKSTKIVFPSEVVKEAWVKRFPALEKKAIVFPVIPDPLFQPLEASEKDRMKATHTGDCEYFFCSGAPLSPAELVQLLKAFSLFKKRLKSNMKLLIDAASVPVKKKEIQAIDSYRYRDDVLIKDLPSPAIKASITAAAYALLSVSGNDCTGLSVAEAFRCQVPVIAAGSVQKERGSDAALFIHSQEPELLAQQMMALFKDETLRSRLILRGMEVLAQNTERFSPDHLLKSILPAAGVE